MDREAEDILAEYNAIRKVYNALDRDDPADAAQRADLKSRYYELDRLYAEIVRRNEAPPIKSTAKLPVTNSSASASSFNPQSADAFAPRPKGEVLWGGVMDELSAEVANEDSQLSDWVDTHTPVEGEEDDYFAELDALTKDEEDETEDIATIESDEDSFGHAIREEVTDEIGSIYILSGSADGDPRIDKGTAESVARTLPELSDADLETDASNEDSSGDESMVEEPPKISDSPNALPILDDELEIGIPAELDDTRRSQDEYADGMATGIRPIECPSCGERLPAGSERCPACRTRLMGTESLSKVPRIRPKVEVKRVPGLGKGDRTAKVLVGIGCIFVLAGGLLAASFSSGVGEEAILDLLKTAGVEYEAVMQYGFMLSAVVALLGGTFLGIGAFMNRFVRVVIPIQDLARTGRVEALERAVAMGEDVNQVDDRNCTPLHFAVVAGQQEAVSVLVSNGADLEMRNERGETALHLACANRDVELVRYLLEQGANVRTRNASGSSVMHVAAWVGDVELMELFREQELDVEGRNNAELTPLHFAATSGHEEAVEYLLRENADQDSSSESGATPLCSAARNGHLGVVQVLLDAGANPNVKEGYAYESPLLVATLNGRKKVVEYLKRHGAIE